MNNNRSNKLGVTLLTINAFIYIPSAFYVPFLSAYYAKAGLDAVQIGILMTIGPLVAIFIQPIWAILSDRTGKRKEVLSLLVIGSGTSLFCFYIRNSFLTYLIASFLLAVFSTAIVPLCDAVVINIADKHQLDFSRIRMGGTVGYAVMVIIAGYIVKQNPALEFVLGFIGYMALLFFVQRLPKTTLVKNPSQQTTHVRPFSQGNEGNHSAAGKQDETINRFTCHEKKPGIFHIFESGQIYFMLIFALISQIGLTFHYCFLGVYMTKLNYSEGMIGFMNCVAAVSEIPILLLINRIIRRVEPIKLITLASLLMGLRILMVTKEGIGFFLFAQSLNGLTYMIIYFCCATFISRNVRPVNQSKGQSVLTIVQAGIGSIVGNITGGYLTDTYGIQMAYRYIAALIIGASAFIAIIQIFCCHKEIESAD